MGKSRTTVQKNSEQIQWFQTTVVQPCRHGPTIGPLLPARLRLGVCNKSNSRPAGACTPGQAHMTHICLILTYFCHFASKIYCTKFIAKIWNDPIVGLNFRLNPVKIREITGAKTHCLRRYVTRRGSRKVNSRSLENLVVSEKRDDVRLQEEPPKCSKERTKNAHAGYYKA